MWDGEIPPGGAGVCTSGAGPSFSHRRGLVPSLNRSPTRGARRRGLAPVACGLGTFALSGAIPSSPPHRAAGSLSHPGHEKRATTQRSRCLSAAQLHTLGGESRPQPRRRSVQLPCPGRLVALTRVSQPAIRPSVHRQRSICPPGRWRATIVVAVPPRKRGIPPMAHSFPFGALDVRRSWPDIRLSPPLLPQQLLHALWVLLRLHAAGRRYAADGRPGYDAADAHDRRALRTERWVR